VLGPFQETAALMSHLDVITLTPRAMVLPSPARYAKAHLKRGTSTPKGWGHAPDGDVSLAGRRSTLRDII
jgi:hypothetical protein